VLRLPARAPGNMEPVPSHTGFPPLDFSLVGYPDHQALLATPSRVVR
jgi:hypothetical protein